jgi:tryptophan synthase beta subunit
MKLAKQMTVNQTIIVNLSGRGDKDIDTVSHYIEPHNHE